jgi:hypothetical protein
MHMQSRTDRDPACQSDHPSDRRHNPQPRHDQPSGAVAPHPAPVLNDACHLWPNRAVRRLLSVLPIPLRQKVSHDIEMRVVELMEGAPESVWIPDSAIELTKTGFCYLRLAGRTIRVPSDSYGELREANIVKVAFLPAAMVAVRVEPVRGIGRL